MLNKDVYGKNIEISVRTTLGCRLLVIMVDYLECLLNETEARILRNSLVNERGARPSFEELNTNDEYVSLTVDRSYGVITLAIDHTAFEDIEEITLDNNTKQELIEELNEFIKPKEETDIEMFDRLSGRGPEPEPDYPGQYRNPSNHLPLSEAIHDAEIHGDFRQARHIRRHNGVPDGEYGWPKDCGITQRLPPLTWQEVEVGIKYRKQTK